MIRNRRTAFTLVELLVVISIIGTLVALLLPAVQAAREAGRNVQCKNQLRELGQGTITFESAKRRYPGYRNIIKAGPAISRIGGWVVEILPAIERQDVYDLWTDPTIPLFQEPRIFLPIMVCPSRGSPDSGRPDNTYISNNGMWVGDFQGLNGIQYSFPAPYNDGTPAPGVPGYWDEAQRAADGIFVDRALYPNVTIRTSDIRDGNSNTILYSESINAEEWDHVTDLAEQGISAPLDAHLAKLGTGLTWLYTLESSAWSSSVDNPAGPPMFYIADAAEYAECKINGFRDLPEPMRPSRARPSSNHPGVVNVVFADKRTTSLNDNIDYHVYQQLMTGDGRRSDVPYRRYLLQDRDYTQ